MNVATSPNRKGRRFKAANGSSNGKRKSKAAKPISKQLPLFGKPPIEEG